LSISCPTSLSTFPEVDTTTSESPENHQQNIFIQIKQVSSESLVCRSQVDTVSNTHHWAKKKEDMMQWFVTPQEQSSASFYVVSPRSVHVGTNNQYKHARVTFVPPFFCFVACVFFIHMPNK
jgi:hypothetical protein